jgi:ATP-dependent Clp protease ATP-binding subunit ClpA
VQFAPLGAEAVDRVVDKFVTELETQLAQKRVNIELTPAARRWLATRGYDHTFGARPMARLIQDHIKRPLAEELLFGKLKDGGKVDVDVADDGLRFAFTPLERAPKTPATAEPA